MKPSGPIFLLAVAAVLSSAAEELAAFQSRFAAKRKARLGLRVNVIEAGETAAEFEGTFVARLEQREAL